MATAQKVIQEDQQEEDGKAGLSLGQFETSAGFILRIAQLTTFERLFSIVPESEIKIGENTVLVAIAENPGVRQGVLADVLKIKWSNMTKLIRSLEDRGLVKRCIPPHDRRSVELHITERGQEIVNATSERMYQSDRQALSMLSDDEYAQLLTLLRKVAGWAPL